jgi:hypothetical protein
MSPFLVCSVDNHNQFPMQFHASDQCSAQSIIMLCHNVKHCTVKPWLYVPDMLHLLTFYAPSVRSQPNFYKDNVCRILHFPGFYSIFGGPHKTIKSGVYQVCNILVLLPCSQLQYSIQALPVTFVVNDKMYLYEVWSRSFKTSLWTPLEGWSWDAPLHWNVALSLLFRQQL